MRSGTGSGRRTSPASTSPASRHYRHARWYAQLHIFRLPFYYIDYAIAETGAMQLAAMDAKSPDEAMETYLALCRTGGTKGVLDIFRSAGLRSPFDDGVMADLARHVARECALAA